MLVTKPVPVVLVDVKYSLSWTMKVRRAVSNRNIKVGKCKKIPSCEVLESGYRFMTKRTN